MRGKTEKEIKMTRGLATMALEEIGYKVLDNTVGTLEPIEEERVNGVNIPLHCLGESLKIMALCDAVVFCKGWQDARGCKIEYMAAKEYGLKIYFDGEVTNHDKTD